MSKIWNVQALNQYYLEQVVSGAGKGGQEGAVAPPMLKKMVLVILPNSMRKLGGGGVGIHLRCEKIINAKYF